MITISFIINYFDSIIIIVLQSAQFSVRCHAVYRPMLAGFRSFSTVRDFESMSVSVALEVFSSQQAIIIMWYW